jgi:hypothetical protein
MDTSQYQAKPTTSSAVWLATALLHRESPDRDAFQVKEIFDKVKELDILEVSDDTIRMHISSHCVAGISRSPDRHRKLTRVRTGWYRLYKIGDKVGEGRENGGIVPPTQLFPEPYRDMENWYQDEYVSKSVQSNESSNNDAYFEKVKQDNSIEIPQNIIKSLDISPGDHIGFIISGDKVILKKAKVRLEV